MLKKLLVVMLFCSVVNANEIQLGYSETKSSVVKDMQYTASFSQFEFDFATLAKYRETNSGYLVLLDAQIKQDLTDDVDVFGFGTYTNDTVLMVRNRLDLGVGLGVDVFKNAENQHKVSYALIQRIDRILGSWRYRYKYANPLVSAKAIFYYIHLTNETRGELSAAVKVIEKVALQMKYEYNSSNSNINYLSTVGLKVKL